MTMASSPSIDMAPSTLRNISPNSFMPRVVSIGPLHRHDLNLQRFEGQKAMYVQKLLYYLKPIKEEEILTACVKKVVNLIGKIKGCYADIKTYNDVKLAKMMVMDACFILEFIRSELDDSAEIPSQFPSSTIHSAVELERAGVKFRPNYKPVAWRLSMEVEMHRCSCILWFLGKPTLRMPVLRINHFTELILRNLIAYEHLSRANAYITSYARAMDMLVDNREDVAKLVRSKVIVNHLGSNEEAASMINRICKEVEWKSFFYSEEWQKLDKHFNSYCSRKCGNLRRTYLNSPWNVIAFFAGIILFVLAMLQTIFTIKSS
ncbi:hypothetical protein E3N88_35580 [Mikania micrantha]|uniref:Uncharacterized protein n=1 Tax=Mikania micrantha TaxID=192012 RepID=A0A5N6M1B3_9ASTR|nr:hypothetical protein E3N88_35580 [Mikania micrantha]